MQDTDSKPNSFYSSTAIPFTDHKASLNNSHIFYAFPYKGLHDEIWMGESKKCVVKNDGGNNNYVIHLSDERDFTHMIIEDSETLGQIHLVRKQYYGRGQYEKHKNDDI